ncbi:hypothetical protein SAMN05216349_10669 [Oribacterium sp. KHPX15]|uniref:plasmid mobilization protein n=1 Tax=Oribacterium sp. KHPX15 TaxID=1855342 RepID=UPI00089B4DF7|nr:hypothetical protein [Oribacterium sp. KHPX15]SEA18681.1 hypothetical protein SAMN05216349_10669 [Oribacterium sp. KHPX15]
MSLKVKDDKNRWRNKTIAFRLSPEEDEELNKRYKLLGYRTKQNYIIDSVLKNKVVAMGNMEMIYQFRQSLKEILTELKRIDKAEDLDEELTIPIRTMLEIIEAMKAQANSQTVVVEIPKTQFDQMMHLKRIRELMSREMEDKNNEQGDSNS